MYDTVRCEDLSDAFSEQRAQHAGAVKRHRSHNRVSEIHYYFKFLLLSATPSLIAFHNMADYHLLFGVFLLINVLLTIRASSLYLKFLGFFFPADTGGTSQDALITGSSSNPATTGTGISGSVYKKLLASYLFVYLLATLSDWLQGPYVYALYAAYGFSSHQIAVLFVAGFGSSKYLKFFHTHNFVLTVIGINFSNFHCSLDDL